MKPVISMPHVFVSGERVEPGIYRDIDSGATVDVREPDALPEGIRIVRTPRRFTRLDVEVIDTDVLSLPRLLAEVA